jgi:hypothetical protein
MARTDRGDLLRCGAAPLAHGRIGGEQSWQGRLRRRRYCFDTPLSAYGPVGRGGEQPIDVAGVGSGYV